MHSLVIQMSCKDGKADERVGVGGEVDGTEADEVAQDDGEDGDARQGVVVGQGALGGAQRVAPSGGAWAENREAATTRRRLAHRRSLWAEACHVALDMQETKQAERRRRGRRALPPLGRAGHW